MQVIENINPIFWEDVARSCDYATYFHTPRWSNIISDTFHYRDVTKGFIFSGGQKAVLPLMVIEGKLRNGFLKSIISGALYVYGGPIAEGELNKQQVSEIIDYMKSKYRIFDYILIRGNPFSKGKALKGFKEVKDKSYIMEIFKYKNESDLFHAYSNNSKRVKRYLQKAAQSNLTINKVNSVEEYEYFYKIYQISKQYWGHVLTNYPIKLFQNMYKFKSETNITFWTINRGQQMIGGELTLCWNDKCQIFLSYHDREYSPLGARRVLLHNIFLDCQENGVRTCDMRQSGGIKGLEQFKRSMGCQEYLFSSWMKENNILAQVRKIKNKLLSLNK